VNNNKDKNIANVQQNKRIMQKKDEVSKFENIYNNQDRINCKTLKAMRQ